MVQMSPKRRCYTFPHVLSMASSHPNFYRHVLGRVGKKSFVFVFFFFNSFPLASLTNEKK